MQMQWWKSDTKKKNLQRSEKATFLKVIREDDCQFLNLMLLYVFVFISMLRTRVMHEFCIHTAGRSLESSRINNLV